MHGSYGLACTSIRTTCTHDFFLFPRCGAVWLTVQVAKSSKPFFSLAGVLLGCPPSGRIVAAVHYNSVSTLWQLLAEDLRLMPSLCPSESELKSHMTGLGTLAACGCKW